MQFLYPNFLFALFALSIPIIIHLFNFRRFKKIYFTNVKFLNLVNKEQRSRNKIRNLILLALRLLALSALIIAFAYPILPTREAGGLHNKNYVAVYIDNSFSMAAKGKEGDLFEEAKESAREVINGFNQNDNFLLITNDFELKHQKWVTKQEALKLIDEIEISSGFKKLSQVLTRYNNQLDDEEHYGSLFIISDFQKSIFDLDRDETKSHGITFVTLKSTRSDNVYIDSAWFENPLWQISQVNQLYVRIRNSSKNTIANGTVSLKINGNQKGLANYSINGGDFTEVQLVYTINEHGINKGELTIEDYPIAFDNQLFFNYNVTDYKPILVINGESEDKALTTALSRERAFKIENITSGNIDHQKLSTYDFLILNGLSNIPTGLINIIKRYVESGKGVFVIPPASNVEVNSYINLLGNFKLPSIGNITQSDVSMKVIDPKNRFFANTFEKFTPNTNMPDVNKYYKTNTVGQGREYKLLEFNNGDPFIMMKKSGAGMFYFSVVPLDETWSNFKRHGLFLPILYRMIYFKPVVDQLYYTLGEENYLSVPSIQSQGENIYKLTGSGSEFIPPQRVLNGKLNLYVERLINQSGHYNLNSPFEDTAIAIYSYNYNRMESVMEYVNETELKQITDKLNVKSLDASNISLMHIVQDQQQGIKLWKWFVLFGLLILLAESLLIRFWR